MSTFTSLIEDPARHALFEATLAAASHATQRNFWEMWENGNHEGDELDWLNKAATRPVRTAPAGQVVWSDREIIEILTDAAEIDKVTGRALGHWEIGRLDQRDMIRRALSR